MIRWLCVCVCVFPQHWEKGCETENSCVSPNIQQYSLIKEAVLSHRLEMYEFMYRALQASKGRDGNSMSKWTSLCKPVHSFHEYFVANSPMLVHRYYLVRLFRGLVITKNWGQIFLIKYLWNGGWEILSYAYRGNFWSEYVRMRNLWCSCHAPTVFSA